MAEQDYRTINIVPGEDAFLDVYAHNIGPLNFDDAVAACESLGSGWRLPTKDELNVVYNNRQIASIRAEDFAYEGVYWSSESPDSPHGLQLTVAWVEIFNSGFQFCEPKGHAHYVRPVRTH